MAGIKNTSRIGQDVRSYNTNSIIRRKLIAERESYSYNYLPNRKTGEWTFDSKGNMVYRVINTIREK